MLDQIVQRKREFLAKLDTEAMTETIKQSLSTVPSILSLSAALKSDPRLSLIAEFKRRSPSKGILNATMDLREIVCVFQSSGAAAVSILTETEFFDGSPDDIKNARGLLDLPILRKDFIIDPFQVWESRALGADALLLIAASLAQHELKTLMTCCDEAGIEALVEVHSEAELTNVLELNPSMIAVNNRDLRSFEVDLNTITRLAPLIPDQIVKISASGVSTRDEMLSLDQSGIDAVLIGESLVTSGDPGSKIKLLLGI